MNLGDGTGNDSHDESIFELDGSYSERINEIQKQDISYFIMLRIINYFTVFGSFIIFEIDDFNGSGVYKIKLIFNNFQ